MKSEKLQKLRDLAALILKHNPKCYLSGGLALNLQNVKTRREPGDIDIYVPFNVKVQPVPGMEVFDDHNDHDEIYEDECYEREVYEIEHIKVDFFSPMEKENDLREWDFHYTDGMPALLPAAIIRFKVEHALDGKSSSYKHKDDVIHILVNN